jgi:hypothetical protein
MKLNHLDDTTSDRLIDRCRKLLDLQMAVYIGSRRLHRTMTDKPSHDSRRSLVKLLQQQQASILETTKLIDKLKAEGAALAIVEVFDELRKDMQLVKSRLEVRNVGLTTQTIEVDIIDTLQEMIRALEPRP